LQKAVRSAESPDPGDPFLEIQAGRAVETIYGREPKKYSGPHQERTFKSPEYKKEENTLYIVSLKRKLKDDRIIFKYLK
jgi:hypothetical protein